MAGQDRSNAEDAEADDGERELAGVLHDVSNALTVLLGWVAEARSPGATPDSLAYALRMVEQRARVGRDLARRAIGAHDGAAAAGPEPDQLDAIVEETVLALEVEAQHAGVTLRRDGTTGARVARGTDVAQVVTNLVMNAIAHAPRGTEIRITSEGTLGGVHVDVEDDGPGVPEPRRASIFDGDSTREGGAGVGLRHGRALARGAGGDLDLVPTPSGAFFRVTWPRLGVVRPSAAPPASRPSALAGMRVLVVEDDEDVTMLLETALAARGGVVVIAPTREAMLAALATGPFDAALVDLSPIARDVEGALSALRGATGERTPVVFVTGSRDALPDSAAALPCVRKPFEIGEIVTALVRVVGASKRA